MRLSIRKGDPGYRSLATCKLYRVFLNDVELFDCETADEERGFVIRTWQTRHPLTRRVVMQRSGLIKGAVRIVRRDAVHQDVTDVTPLDGHI